MNYSFLVTLFNYQCGFYKEVNQRPFLDFKDVAFEMQFQQTYQKPLSV